MVSPTNKEMRLFFFKPDIEIPGGSGKKTWQTVIEDCTWVWTMKIFAAIEFKQKWIMPFCSPTHLALDWYWTLIAQIDFWLSNRLVKINHLNLPHQIFSSVFAPARNFYFRFGKKTRVGSQSRLMSFSETGILSRIISRDESSHETSWDQVSRDQSHEISLLLVPM